MSTPPVHTIDIGDAPLAGAAAGRVSAVPRGPRDPARASRAAALMARAARRIWGPRNTDLTNGVDRG
jgi:hypothetical protein